MVKYQVKYFFSANYVNIFRDASHDDTVVKMHKMDGFKVVKTEMIRIDEFNEKLKEKNTAQGL